MVYKWSPHWSLSYLTKGRLDRLNLLNMSLLSLTYLESHYTIVYTDSSVYKIRHVCSRIWVYSPGSLPNDVLIRIAVITIAFMVLCVRFSFLCPPSPKKMFAYGEKIPNLLLIPYTCDRILSSYWTPTIFGNTRPTLRLNGLYI